MKKSIQHFTLAIVAAFLVSGCAMLQSAEDATMKLYPGQTMEEVKKIMRWNRKVAGFEEDGTVIWQCIGKEYDVFIRFRNGRVVSVLPAQKPMFLPLPTNEKQK